MKKESRRELGEINFTEEKNKNNIYMNKNGKKEGLVKRSKEQEEMRSQVSDLEMKARYWKAQYDIRHYTLESEKLQPEYNTWLEDSKKAQEQAMATLMAEIEKAKENGLKPEEAEDGSK